MFHPFKSPAPLGANAQAKKIVANGKSIPTLVVPCGQGAPPQKQN
jgi:hypothetical protein